MKDKILICFKKALSIRMDIGIQLKVFENFTSRGINGSTVLTKLVNKKHRKI